MGRLYNNRYIIRTVLSYALFGSLWIYFSDSILNSIAGDEISLLQTYKGLLFIFVTSLFLFGLLKHFVYSYNKEKAKREESEFKFSKLAENSNDLIFVYRIKPEPKFEYVSPSSLKILGYSPEEFYEDNELNLKIIHPDDLEKSKNMLENFTEPKVLKTIKKDGEIVWTELQLTPIYNDENEIEGFQGISRDVTERIKTRKMLEENAERYKKLFDENPLPMWIYELETLKFLDVNQAAIEKYGYSKDEFLAMTLLDIRPEEEHERLRNDVKFYKNEVQVSSPWKHKLKDGTIIFVEIKSQAINIQGKTSRLVLINDITARIKAEQQLRLTRIGVEKSQIGVFQLNDDGSFIYVNEYACKLLGYSKAELTKLNIKSIDVNLTKEEWTNYLKKINDAGTDTFETVHKKKDGSTFPVEVTINNFQFEGRSITFAFVQDISERKKMLSDIIDAKNKAENSEKIKTEFLAQMSHEIRTPINAMINYSYLLKDECSLKMGSELKFIFDGIEISSSRIIRTIDLILNMSELQTKSYIPQYVDLDIAKISSDCINQIKHLGEIKKLKINFNNSAASTILKVDEYSVHQIIINLLDNAVKYTAEGQIDLNITEYNNSLILSVKDTGIGMSVDFLENLFKPFSQEESGYSRRYDGNGLGLALVKKYCDINYADISVESEKGKGSIFKVSFPKK